jgi:hypothetical protein
MDSEPSVLQRRTPAVVAAVFALLVALGAVLVAHRHATLWPDAPALHPLAVVPAGPALLVSVDVARLRQTRAGAAFVKKSLAEVAPLPCEGSLLAEIDELAFAMPSETSAEAASDTFALIASGRFTAASVSACAEARIRARGGTALTTTLGSFKSVRARNRAGELAVRDGLVVLSNGSYLRELVDAADGHRADGTPAEHQRDELHVELRRVTGRGAPVIATLVLTPGWLSRTLADPTAERSPLAAIRTAALRADVTGSVDLTGVVSCETADACEHLERFVTQARADLATFAPGFAELLARVRFVRTGARLALEAHVSDGELEARFAQRAEAPAAAAPDARAPGAGAGAPQSHAP